MRAHCLDACNVYFSARCRHYTNYLIKQALMSNQASSLEAERAEMAKLRAEIAKKRAADKPVYDDDDDKDDFGYFDDEDDFDSIADDEDFGDL